MELIANWITLSHRDAGGAQSHYDLLASLGIGHDATFSIKKISMWNLITSLEHWHSLQARYEPYYFFPEPLLILVGRFLSTQWVPGKLEKYLLLHIL
jgi:hypothetical protein